MNGSSVNLNNPLPDCGKWSTYNENSNGRASPFSLAKLAYNSCGPEQRNWYTTVPKHAVPVDIKECCAFMMAPGDRLRDWDPVDPDTDVCSKASYNGHLDCLRQAHLAGIPWNWRTVEAACRGGQVECLHYAHMNGCDTGGYLAPMAAACAGNLTTLEYTWVNGFKFPKNLCTLIARFGSLESLKYLRSLGFAWDVTTTAAAARFNQLPFLRYLHQNDCPWDVTTCIAAAQNGNLECLQYAHTNGCEWDMRTCHAAAQNGNLECLMYARNNGCEWNILTTMSAAVNRQKACFRFAVENGCVWPEWLTWEKLGNDD